MTLTGKRTKSSAAKLPPPTALDLAPENIEQASRIDEDYVLVKLRKAHIKPSTKTNTAQRNPSASYPPITMQGFSALHRWLRDILLPHNAHPENQAFLDKLATQSQETRKTLASSGLLIEAKELARRLGISVQAISKALKAKRLFDLECEGGKRLYPAFYADPEISRATLGVVTRVLADAPPSAKWQFFTRPELSLNRRTPLQALKEGDVKQVLCAAQGFIER